MSLINSFKKIFKRKKSSRPRNQIVVESSSSNNENQQIFNAISSRCYVLANVLLKRSDINFRYSSGAAPLIYLVQNCTENEQKEAFFLLDFLLCEGSAINATDVYGKTAYDYANENGLTDMKDAIMFAINLQSIMECF